MQISEKKKTISWALYDWANSAFSTTVVAGFFPVFFKKYWSQGEDITLSTFKLGIANSIASIVIAILAPLLGSIADYGGIKRKFLIFFTTLGAVMTIGLYFAEEGEWRYAIFLYILASVGFAGANTFYDSQLVDIVPAKKFHSVSALGYALGYLGGGLLFAVNVYMTINPNLFGLNSSAEAVRVSFVTVGVWWIAFSLPIFLFVKDPEPEEKNMDRKKSYTQLIIHGSRTLAATAKHISTLRPLLLFLLAYFLYIDGVGTVIKMAIDYGMSIGLESNSLITALLITQFIGFPSAMIFGWIGNKVGAKKGVYLALIVYIFVTIMGYSMDSTQEFYLLAIAVGLVMGGIQSLSRSIYAAMIPESQSAEFFGFFNLFGKFAAIMGPAVMGYVGHLTKSPRLSILSLIVFFVVGGVLLSYVDETYRAKASSA
ncbi:MAG: MFS transporter [Bdellovibrionota bacterium]